jgi:hypothetical protein
MKKLSVLFISLLALSGFGTSVKAQEAEDTSETLSFGYDAGAEIVSSYLWRGQYNGGLSFQPDVAVGWDSRHTSFRIGTWWSVGASDWTYQRGLEKTDGYNPNTYFMPELDIYANLNLWGATIGFTHYYYFGGSNFLSQGKIDKVKDKGWTSQTEVSIGYDFSTLLDIPLTITWYTMVSGDDGYMKDMTVNEDGEIEGTWRRAYSSYLEIGYTHTWEEAGVSLGGTLGISPWKSMYTDMDWQEVDEDNNIVDDSRKFAVNNISLRVEKTWTLGDDVCTISLFGVGMLNTCNLNKETVITHNAGDDQLYVQKLNGAVGMSIWF